MQLAPSDFLASTAVSFPVFSSILIGFPSPSVVFQGVALERKSVALPDVSPLPQVSAAFDLMCANAIDASSKARLQAVSAPESGLWLNALPLSSIGLHMDDTTIQVAVGLRLGLPLCHLHSCRHCDGNVVEFATHGLSYRCSEGRHLCHSSVNSVIQCVFSAAGVPSHLEPSGLVRSDGKKPDHEEKKT